MTTHGACVGRGGGCVAHAVGLLVHDARVVLLGL